MGFYDTEFMLLICNFLSMWLLRHSCCSNSPNIHGSKSNKYLHTHHPFYYLIPNMYYISLHTLYKLQSKRLVTMSVSLHTQTGLHHLPIQVLNTRVCFIDYNLEHRLAIVTKSFSPLDLDYITSFVNDQIRSDMTSHAIL